MDLRELAESPLSESDSRDLDTVVSRLTRKFRADKKVIQWSYRIKTEIRNGSNGVQLMYDIIREISGFFARGPVRSMLQGSQKYIDEFLSDEGIQWLCDEDRMRELLTAIKKTPWKK